MRLLAVLALCIAASAQAASLGIQRCRGGDGATIYTDTACAALGARAEPIRGELLERLARENARAAGEGGLAGSGLLARAGEAEQLAALSHMTRSPAAGCARTPRQLALNLQGALMLGDVNRVAESYHWTGLDHRQGQRVLARLQRLAGKPLLHADYFDARIGPFAAADAGILQLTLGDGNAPTVVDFDVRRHSGCYFVEF